MKKETRKSIGIVLTLIGLIMIVIGALAVNLTDQIEWIVLVTTGIAGPILWGIIIIGSTWEKQT